jgi:RsiW-degrading membrane proteinase PrsW (M82 family)
VIESPRARRSLWLADAAALVGVGVLVVVAAVLDAVVPPLRPVELTLVGVVVATVPAVLWLVAFYRRDRLEPEPRGIVATVAVLGCLLAAAIGRPLVEEVFDVDSWLSVEPTVNLLGSVLVVGMVQETLKFAGLRFGIYRSSEFDGPTDGIVYGTAIGLGYATVLNVAFIVESGGADLALATIRIALFSLVHASLGGLIGYALGRQRLGVGRVWSVAAAVAIAAVLDGAFLVIRGAIVSGPMPSGTPDVTPWVALVAATLLAVTLTLILQRLVAREIAAESAS